MVLTFQPGSVRMCVGITILEDAIGEDTEFFSLRLDGVFGTRVNIEDNGKCGAAGP